MVRADIHSLQVSAAVCLPYPIINLVGAIYIPTKDARVESNLAQNDGASTNLAQQSPPYDLSASHAEKSSYEIRQVTHPLWRSLDGHSPPSIFPMRSMAQSNRSTTLP